MSIRTDLALEQKELRTDEIPGVESYDSVIGDVRINHIKITGENGARVLAKPVGDYITVEFGNLEAVADYSEIKTAVTKSLCSLMPHVDNNFLVVGLGNADITPDALGPLTVNGLFATRHIDGGLAGQLGLERLRSVAAIAPGVLGKTGIETAEAVSGMVSRIKPSAVIVIDALAARTVSRICNTVQLCNTGISPGSGVHNSRSEISEKTLGIPVIAVGIPTVVDIGPLIYQLTGEDSTVSGKNMIVTPKEIDLLIDRAAELLSQSLNLFLQPHIDEEIILSLV